MHWRPKNGKENKNENKVEKKVRRNEILFLVMVITIIIHTH